MLSATLSRSREKKLPLHFNRLVTSTANNFIRDKVNAIDLVGMPWEVGFEFVRLEIPDLVNPA